MSKFFCADAARQAKEDLIGSGTPYQTYVLIECPLPWAANAFESPAVPHCLRAAVEKIGQEKRSVRFLLVHRTHSLEKWGTTVLIYQQDQWGFSRGYEKQEFCVQDLEQVSQLLDQYFYDEAADDSEQANSRLRKFSQIQHSTATRDILVCTHGSHDKCCAKYGIPFYRAALQSLDTGGLNQIRLWKASHFGGHRFAPTIIDLPEGRYYGRLDPLSWQTILTRTGEMNCLNWVYRGWGILPTAMQVLERELMLLYGWDWYQYGVAARMQSWDNSATIQAEIRFQQPNGTIYGCEAYLVPDDGQTLCLKGSCDAVNPYRFVKYAIARLEFTAHPARVVVAGRSLH